MIIGNTQKFLVGVCAVIFSLTYSIYASKTPDWTFAIYMEAGISDLHYWIHKNMNDMALAHSDAKNLNIVIQVHLEKSAAWRYAIRHNGIKPVETTTLGNDLGQNIVDFMTWVVQQYPAKHYGLIFWGNGFGILDPTYQPTSTDYFPWAVEPDELGHECVGGVCPLKNVDFPLYEHVQHHTCKCVQFNREFRGLLFTEAHSFVTNATMVATLKAIKETVLKGKKLDILGTDCCKMAMLEVGYQIKDFTNYLVGSQNCELADGWDYKSFFSYFNEKKLDALAVVQAIVRTYGDYYKKNTIQNTYTLSALDLAQLDSLVANLNEIVVVSKKLTAENKSVFKTAVINARVHSPSMCGASYYLDLWSVYANIAEELGKPESAIFDTESVAALKNLLVHGQELITSVVVANACGMAVANLHGISIYFPRNRIDESYFLTAFAQETLWLSFLQELIG